MVRAAITAVVVALTTAVPAVRARSGEAVVETRVVHDEARKGDLGPAKADAEALFTVSEPGIHVVQGTGTDAVDDIDSFVFKVVGKTPFDFCLVGDAAEFKWLRAIEEDGTTRDVAFGSTNLAYRAPPNITKDGLPPGKYRVEMMFGPDGASGEWVVKVAWSDGRAIAQPLCQEAVEPTTTDKLKKAEWPGAISIFHGHNWGEDKKYVVAIQEAGFGGAGATEGQIADCRGQGLRAFVFIWPHEVTTIPAKHKDDSTVLCYYLSDRIPPHKWGAWASLERTAFKVAPRHPAIFTMRGLWGGIERFCPDVRGRVMEYYHYHWDGDRSPHMHFALLERYRRASAANGYVPVCRVVETRPEDIRKTRHTVFTSLAYGVRGFRMGGHGIFDAKNRDARGVPVRNALGEEIRRINGAIRAYSSVFATARCRVVYHTTPLPAGCVAAPDDAWVKPAGQDVLVGVFRDEGPAPAEKGSTSAAPSRRDYLLVANRDAFQERTATLRIFRQSIQVDRMDRISARWTECAAETEGATTLVRLVLEAGGGELLRVVRAAGGAPAAPDGER